MPALCSKCYREAPCVSVEGLHTAGWQVGGPFNSMGWKCPACLGDEIFHLMEKNMKVRAKFTVESVLQSKETATVKLMPVVSGSEENKQFYKWTPGGSISLDLINKEMAALFEPGKSYYVDFAPAE